MSRDQDLKLLPDLRLLPVLPGLFLHRSRLSDLHQPVNSYIWNTPCGGVVIDPAADLTPKTFPAIAEATHIFVTHIQEEHIAGAANFPKARLYVPEGDEYLCDGAAAYEKLIQPWEEPWDWEGRGNFRGHLAGARNERPPQHPLPVAGVLCDGEEICGLKVLATPGHGKHAVTLLADIEDRRVAFCGDLICGRGQLWNWFDCDWDYGPQTGQKMLLASTQRLLAEKPDVLLPAHGEPVFEAQAALQLLIERLEKVLAEEPSNLLLNLAPLNFPEKDGPAPGWRELSPHLFQWKTGNCALLVSRDDVGLLVDDGLCHWVPLPERAAHHHAVMAQIKERLGLSHLEVVIVTHYHGDHIENIPALVEDEGSQVVTLDVVAQVMEQPERFNLIALLGWYGAGHDRVPLHRTLSDGEIFRWHEYDLEIFHLGGQTYYHAGIAAQVDDERVVFVGDALYGWNPGCDPVLCYNDAEPSSGGWAYSIERLLERRPDLIVCGHGSAIRQPQLLLEAKRAAWARRLAEFDALNVHSDRQSFFSPYFPKK